VTKLSLPLLRHPIALFRRERRHMPFRGHQMTDTSSREFKDQLTTLLPRMRIWARALTHNRLTAEDLLQDTAMKALLASSSFEPGTNFTAWVHRIMVNHFISGVRSRREYTAFEQMPEVGVVGGQEDQSDLRELSIAWKSLPPGHQEALQLIAVEERSYEEVADATGCPIGTLKSRVHRARQMLRSHMNGECRLAA
jgi:RNA polymerase sigma-70 factor (ECF subfamily)